MGVKLAALYWVRNIYWGRLRIVLREGLTDVKRRRYWEGLVHRSMIHTRQSLSVFYCGIFHLQNTFQCACIRYNLVLFAVFFSLMFWVSYLINQDNATAFCIIRKYTCSARHLNSLQQTCTLKDLSINVSVLPSNAPHCYYFPLCPSTWMKLGL